MQTVLIVVHLIIVLALIGVGALFIVWGRSRSEFVVYRLLLTRSRILWGDRVHGFYQVSGAMMIVVGILVAVI